MLRLHQAELWQFLSGALHEIVSTFILMIHSVTKLAWLKELDLSYNRQLSSDADSLSRQLSKLTSLTKLNLSECGLKEVPNR